MSPQGNLQGKKRRRRFEAHKEALNDSAKYGGIVVIAGFTSRVDQDCLYDFLICCPVLSSSICIKFLLMQAFGPTAPFTVSYHSECVGDVTSLNSTLVPLSAIPPETRIPSKKFISLIDINVLLFDQKGLFKGLKELLEATTPGTWRQSSYLIAIQWGCAVAQCSSSSN